MSTPTSTSLAVPTPSKTAGHAPVRRVDALFSVASFGKASSRSGDSPEAITSTVTLCDATVVYCDRRIVRCSGWWVHSDVLGKILSFLSDTIEGVHVKTIPIAMVQCWGVAVNASETLMVVSHSDYGYNSDELYLYSLPGGELLRTIGGKGVEPGLFRRPNRLCFSPDDVIIIADQNNDRLQVLSSTGEYNRSICVNAPSSVRISHDARLIAVGLRTDGVQLLQYNTGTLLKTLTVGHIGSACAVAFSQDDSEVYVIGIRETVVLVFDVASGVLAKQVCRSAPLSQSGYKDLCVATNGDIVVSDADNHRIWVYGSDGVTKKVEFGVKGDTAGTLNGPGTLCLVSGRLYVLNAWSPRVEVFE